jgi:hypothetical protein
MITQPKYMLIGMATGKYREKTTVEGNIFLKT